jgi:hypothetical protein
MKNITWILAAFVFYVGTAHAFDDVKVPFTLSCRGELGGAYFQQTDKGMIYSVDTEHKHFAGFVLPYAESGTKWEEGGASILDPAYEHNKKWLSVSALHGHKEWNPPHEDCMPTRSPVSPCVKIHVPGSFSNIPDEWVSLMVDITDPSTAKFMNLDIFEKEFANLGANVQCTLSGV